MSRHLYVHEYSPDERYLMDPWFYAVVTWLIEIQDGQPNHGALDVIDAATMAARIARARRREMKIASIMPGGANAQA